MRRRIIKQGHSTLTVTLPNKWVKKNNLKPKDEIDLFERGNNLLITVEKQNFDLVTELDISELDIPVIWKYFMAIYREGYHEIKVKFNPNQFFGSPYKFFTSYAFDLKYRRKPQSLTPFETIQIIANRFIGFEVIEHRKDYCIIREMSEISGKEFDSALRRVFLLILQMGEIMLEAIKTNNLDLLKPTNDMDINVDKFHDYCVRILNKKGLEKKPHLMFTSLFILELVGDEFKNVARHLLEEFKNKRLNNLKPVAELIIQQLNAFYSLFYSFNKEKVIEMSKRDYDVHFYLPKLYYKESKKEIKLSEIELEIFNHFRRMSKLINALTELRLEMEF